MNSYLQVRVSARYVLSLGETKPLATTLRFHTNDPFVAIFDFDEPDSSTRWEIGMELLEQAFRDGHAHPEGGDISLTLDREAQEFKIYLTNQEGEATITFPLDRLWRFTARALDLATPALRDAYLAKELSRFYDLLGGSQ